MTMDIPVAANVLGTVGAVCWSVQLIPQIVINYRRHDTTGLQPTMMLLWATAGIPLGVYNIVQSFNIALRIQPQILAFLSLITWAQCKYYGIGTKWPWQKCLLTATSLGVVMGGIEVGLVFGIKEAAHQGYRWPTIVMGVLSGVLLCAGVLRHYWDIYKERTVRGISFLFVGIDAMGDLTSLISVCFQPQLDILGVVIYGSELVLWLGVFACGGWFNLRPRVKQILRERRSAVSVTEEHHNGNIDVANDIDPNRLAEVDQGASPASSTVFRTASSMSSERPPSEHELRYRNITRV